MIKINFENNVTKANADTFNTMQDNIEDSIDTKQDTLVSGTNIKTINGSSILGSGNVEISGEVDVDDTVSTTSTNPIENQAITNYVNDNIKTKVTTLWSGSKNSTGDIILSDSYANYDLIAISIAAPDQESEQIFWMWANSIVQNKELNYSIFQKTDTCISVSCKFTATTTLNVIKFSNSTYWSGLMWIKSIKGINL